MGGKGLLQLAYKLVKPAREVSINFILLIDSISGFQSSLLVVSKLDRSEFEVVISVCFLGLE